MSKLDDLFGLAVIENIRIGYVNKIIRYDAGALYIARDGIRMILIIESLKNNIIHLTEILSEELGYYFTGTRYNYSVDSYSDKLKIDRCKNKAFKWAITS